MFRDYARADTTLAHSHAAGEATNQTTKAKQKLYCVHIPVYRIRTLCCVMFQSTGSPLLLRHVPAYRIRTRVTWEVCDEGWAGKT